MSALVAKLSKCLTSLKSHSPWQKWGYQVGSRQTWWFFYHQDCSWFYLSHLWAGLHLVQYSQCACLCTPPRNVATGTHTLDLDHLHTRNVFVVTIHIRHHLFKSEMQQLPISFIFFIFNHECYTCIHMFIIWIVYPFLNPYEENLCENNKSWKN